jgi:3,4-dihydroxy 2-butanone 4-phosphate synthase/GTP cyclohydrolase II
MTPFASVEAALEDVRAGCPVVVVDDERRKGEGHLTVAAELVEPATINFMAREARGLVCLTVTAERAERLGLSDMAPGRLGAYGEAFLCSIEARVGVSTGISAFDRAHTIRAAASVAATAHDLVSPGHVIPLRARRDGVIERPGHTEASTDLARLAGLAPIGVICAIMNDDGSMARVGDLTAYCRRHGVPMLRIDALIEYRRRLPAQRSLAACRDEVRAV